MGCHTSQHLFQWVTKEALRDIVYTRYNTLTNASPATHNLSLFVLALIAAPTDHIFSSVLAFLTRTLSILHCTVFTSASNRFTVALETAVTEFWCTFTTRVSIAHNLAVMFWLEKEKNFGYCFYYQDCRGENPFCPIL